MNNFSLNKISYLLGSDRENISSFSKNFPDWDIKKIISKTGINKIHKVKKDETAVDLAVAVFNNFLNEYSYDKKNIDSLIFVTQSPDYCLPTSACIVQNRVKLRKDILVFDINLGCSGFVNGLSVAYSLIRSNMVKNCALICSETYSKYISPHNRTCSTIFSDGASITLVEKEGNTELGPFHFGVDGSGYRDLIVENSGSKKVDGKETELYMNGPKILLFTLSHIPDLINKFLKKNKMSIEDIDLFFFHQASKTVLEALRAKMKIPKNKFIYDLDKIGNTISSTIPISIKLALDENKIKKGNKILIIGFGVGYSSGIGLLKWDSK